jgi:hypothetical protein
VRVNFLLQEDNKNWGAVLVESLFHNDLAKAILAIPISRNGGEDFISWPHDKFGQYTVRSAYNLSRTESFFARHQVARLGAQSDQATETKNWMSIWTIEAPSKMKIVLWRMAHDCLPTGQQLLHRNIPANDQCVFCGQTERVEYLFLLCPFARTVWAAVKERFPLQLRRNCMVSAKQWIFDYLAREHAVNATVLAVVCWHIWEARNDTRNNEGRLHRCVLRQRSSPMST